jgi:hypothetical protein
MSKLTASAAGAATPEAPKSRRALLRLFGAAPALAILPAAALPPITALANLIEEHRAAWAASGQLVEALEAAEPDGSILVPCLAREPTAVKGRIREDLINVIEENFEFEVKKLNRLLELSPELGAAALERLERERDACRARLEEVFADYRVAEDAWQEASDAEEDALTAICAHRCASMEEVATKVRYLAGLGSELMPNQRKAFFGSFFADGEEIAEI